MCLPDGQSIRQFETLIDINKDVSAQAKRMAIIGPILRLSGERAVIKMPSLAFSSREWLYMNWGIRDET